MVSSKCLCLIPDHLHLYPSCSPSSIWDSCLFSQVTPKWLMPLLPNLPSLLLLCSCSLCFFQRAQSSHWALPCMVSMTLFCGSFQFMLKPLPLTPYLVWLLTYLSLFLYSTSSWNKKSMLLLPLLLFCFVFYLPLIPQPKASMFYFCYTSESILVGPKR